MSLIILCPFADQTRLDYALILPDSSSSNGKNITLYLDIVYSPPSLDMFTVH